MSTECVKLLSSKGSEYLRQWDRPVKLEYDEWEREAMREGKAKYLLSFYLNLCPLLKIHRFWDTQCHGEKNDKAETQRIILVSKAKAARWWESW